MEVCKEELATALAVGRWEVCGDCHRACRRGEHRAMWVLHEDTGEEELVELCPYGDCDAQPRFEAIEWASLARCHPDSLPQLPQRDVLYSW